MQVCHELGYMQIKRSWIGRFLSCATPWTLVGRVKRSLSRFPWCQTVYSFRLLQQLCAFLCWRNRAKAALCIDTFFFCSGRSGWIQQWSPQFSVLVMVHRSNVIHSASITLYSIAWKGGDLFNLTMKAANHSCYLAAAFCNELDFCSKYLLFLSN